MPDHAAAGRGSDNHGKLRRDLVDAQEQLAATNEVLAALGRNASNPDAVLTMIVDTACRLCRADSAFVNLIRGDQFPVAKSASVSDYLALYPPTLDRGVLIGRVALARRTEQIVDVLVDPDYGRHDLQRLAGFRTIIGAPMLVDHEVVGVLSMWRLQPAAFDQRDMTLLETLSSQAAIAIRTLDLVTTLARKVEQLEALAEVGEAVTSSLDLDEVLTTIVMNAVRMSGADGGSIMQYVEEARGFSVRTAYGTSADLLEKLRGVKIDLETTLVGRSGARRPPTPGAGHRPRRPRPAPASDVRAGLAVRPRRADAAPEPLRRRVRRPPKDARRVLRGHGRPARDHRQPVRARHPQRGLLSRAGAEDARAGGREPAQVGVPREHVA